MKSLHLLFLLQSILIIYSSIIEVEYDLIVPKNEYKILKL